MTHNDKALALIDPEQALIIQWCEIAHMKKYTELLQELVKSLERESDQQKEVIRTMARLLDEAENLLTHHEAYFNQQAELTKNVLRHLRLTRGQTGGGAAERTAFFSSLVSSIF